jgi:probable F420-dependent oxidoreductase
MEFTVSIPTCREGLSLPLPFASPSDTVKIAVRAEELGYHSVWGNDHITPPAYVLEDYQTPPQWLEPMTTLAFVAGKTRKIKLGTAVLVMPLRDPVWVAKQTATLDVLSGGRVILGVGIGAYREEFRQLKPREQGAHRGDMFSEALQVINLILAQRQATFSGKYYAFHDLKVYPKPIQNPFPLLAGGNHENELRRVAKYCTGWMGASIAPEKLKERIRLLKELASKVGRDPEEIKITTQVAVAMGRTQKDALKRFQESRMYTHLQTLQASTLRGHDFDRIFESNLIGTPQAIIDRVGMLQDIGVSMLASQSFLSPNVQDMLEQIQFFAEEVMPAFKT